MALTMAGGLPPTTLWVVPVAELGGVARHVLDVARVGIPGWRLVVACPPGPLAAALAGLGAAVLTAPISPADGARTAIPALRHLVSTLRPQLVHSHLSFADVIAVAATRGLPVGVVTTEHGIAADDLIYHGSRRASAAKAALHTARLRATDAVIAVSRSTADVVRAKWRPPTTLPITVVLNGVDAPPVTPGRTPGWRIASVARLAPEKRLDLLLRSFASVRDRRPEALLTIAGDGPLRDELQALTTELGLGDRVSFPGHVDAAELLARTDVLVQLSVWENCSYSLLDAVVHGCGVVATPVGGNPEILGPPSLVADTAPAGVAARIAEQAEDLTLRPRLPQGWPTVAEMTREIANVYAAALARRGGRGWRP